MNIVWSYYQFYQKLAQNNNKVWFDEHKKEYQLLRKNYVVYLEQEIIPRLVEMDPYLGFIEPHKCLYRVNRDIRFSPNKMPYKTHLSSIFCRDKKDMLEPAYYYQIDQNKQLFVGGGLYMIDSKDLFAFRTTFTKHPELYEEYQKLINNKRFSQTFNNQATILKSHPRGFSKDHPYINLLKQKSYIYGYSKPISEYSDTEFTTKILSEFTIISPYILFLRELRRVTFS